MPMKITTMKHESASTSKSTEEVPKSIRKHISRTGESGLPWQNTDDSMGMDVDAKVVPECHKTDKNEDLAFKSEKNTQEQIYRSANVQTSKTTSLPKKQQQFTKRRHKMTVLNTEIGESLMRLIR